MSKFSRSTDKNKYNDKLNMILSTLEQVLAMPEGTDVAYVQGKIVKIEPYLSAGNANSDPKSPTSFNCQRVHLQDETATVMVKFWERTEMPQDRLGVHIHLMMGPDELGKLGGVRTKIQSSREGKVIYLNVGKQAVVSANPPEAIELPESLKKKPTVAKPEEKAKPQNESFESFGLPSPQQKRSEATAPATGNAPAKAPKTHPQPGPRVGMAMNLACANLTALGKPLNPEDVMDITSDLLRIAEWFEAGNLRPTFTERQKQKQQQ